MGRMEALQKKIDAISDDKLHELGVAAENEKRRMLKSNPKLISMQVEIDRRLAKAISPQRRMAVVGFMMEGGLRDMADGIRRLNLMLSDTKNE